MLVYQGVLLAALRWSSSCSRFRTVLATRSPCSGWRSSPPSPSEDESGSTAQHRGLDLRASDGIRGSHVRPAGGDDRRSVFVHWRLPHRRPAERTERAARRSTLCKWGVYTCIRAIYGAAAGFAAAAACAPSRTDGVTQTRRRHRYSRPRRRASRSRVRRLHWQAPRRSMRCCSFGCARPMYARFDLPLHADRRSARGRLHADVSPWTLPLFFLPALAAQRLFGLYQEQRQLADQLVDANTDLEKANISFATALVTTLDARDRYTAGHSAAVAIYARDIAIRMGLPDEETQQGSSCRSRSRHRQDRALGGPAREARCAHARGAARNAAPLGDRRTHPGEGR